MGLRIWPERSPSGVAHSAQMWEGDEGILAVWDTDLYTTPVADFDDLQCQMTIFNGSIVYTREGVD